MGKIVLKRAYDEPSGEDGLRILADRLWPRGLARAKAKVDLWVKDVAPSEELRKWFGHDPERWPEFRERYLAELEGQEESVDALRRLAKKSKRLTLLFAARDTEHNNAVVLREAVTRSRRS